jgi:hypothetical protein
MAITLNGSGSITGLSSGAGISASALSGQVPDANAPSGSVIQVVHLQTYGYTTNATSTYVDVPNYTLSITPSSTSSKILVAINLNGCGKYSGTTWGRFRLLRNGSEICVFNDSAGWTGTSTESNHSVGFDYLDEPATTSSVTYKVQFNCPNNTAAAQVGNYVGAVTNARHSLVLTEIAG